MCTVSSPKTNSHRWSCQDLFNQSLISISTKDVKNNLYDLKTTLYKQMKYALYVFAGEYK